MPRRNQHEPFDRNRGRHRKAASRETAVWNGEHLIPKCPPWMSPAAYRALAALRDRGLTS